MDSNLKYKFTNIASIDLEAIFLTSGKLSSITLFLATVSPFFARMISSISFSKFKIFCISQPFMTQLPTILMTYLTNINTFFDIR